MIKTAYILTALQSLALASPGWIENIEQGRGLLIAIIGMTVVFSGLVLISLVIRLLIRLFEDRRKKEKPVQTVETHEENELSEEEVLAITTAINLCSIYIEGEKQRLTWEFDQHDQSSWSVTGRAQTLAQRSNISRLKG